MLSKLFCSNAVFVRVFTLEHSPETNGLIFKHIWSLCGKLPTCLIAYFQVISIGCDTTLMTPTKLPSLPCHVSFGLPTGLCKPRGQRFSPLVRIFWSRDVYLLNHPCRYRFLQNEAFYCCCSFLVADGCVSHESSEFRYKPLLSCVFYPFLC